jgi:hypothetical protein
LLVLLIFLVLKSYKIDNVKRENAEVKFTREPGTASEEKEREDRRINLNSIFFEGITPQNTDNIFFILSTTVRDRFIPRYVSFRQVCSIESACKEDSLQILYTNVSNNIFSNF